MIDIEIRDVCNDDYLTFTFTNAQAADAITFVKAVMEHPAGDYVVNVRLDNKDKEDI